MEPIISRTAHDLVDSLGDDYLTVETAREAAREIKPLVGRTIKDLVPMLRGEVRRQRRIRASRAARRQFTPCPIRQSLVELYQTCEVDADHELRRALRRLAGCHDHDSCPVRVVWGTSQPCEAGEPGYKTTLSGLTLVTANSYGWPTLYHCSTRRVEVGVGWLATHLAVLMAGQAA